MKKYISLFIAILAIVWNVPAQDKSSSGEILLRSDPPRLSGNPLFIISAGNKKLTIADDVAVDSLSATDLFRQIDPNWIESIAVLKDKAATEQYGMQGQNGVILIEFKNGILEKVPAELSRRFKETN